MPKLWNSIKSKGFLQMLTILTEAIKEYNQALTLEAQRKEFQPMENTKC